MCANKQGGRASRVVQTSFAVYGKGVQFFSVSFYAETSCQLTFGTTMSVFYSKKLQNTNEENEERLISIAFERLSDSRVSKYCWVAQPKRPEFLKIFACHENT